MIVARALVVGFACAVLHNIIMIVGDWAGLHYAVSLVYSFVIVVVVGYLLHSGWTFRGAQRSGTSFLRYVLVASANYPASLVGMYIFVDVMGFVVPIASPIVTVLLFIVNFLGNRWALRASLIREARPGRSSHRI
jgi:putative flippase GtrA